MKSPPHAGFFVRVRKLAGKRKCLRDHYGFMTDLSASRFYRAIRQFAVTEPAWSPVRVVVQTTPADRWDLTLISQRVYGNRDEFLAVMAAAGLTRYDDILAEQLLVLPTKERLAQIKQQCSFSSTPQRSVR